MLHISEIYGILYKTRYSAYSQLIKTRASKWYGRTSKSNDYSNDHKATLNDKKEGRDWDRNLKKVARDLNSSINKTTNKTPNVDGLYAAIRKRTNKKTNE